MNEMFLSCFYKWKVFFFGSSILWMKMFLCWVGAQIWSHHWHCKKLILTGKEKLRKRQSFFGISDILFPPLTPFSSPLLSFSFFSLILSHTHTHSLSSHSPPFSSLHYLPLSLSFFPALSLHLRVCESLTFMACSYNHDTYLREKPMDQRGIQRSSNTFFKIRLLKHIGKNHIG